MFVHQGLSPFITAANDCLIQICPFFAASRAVCPFHFWAQELRGAGRAASLVPEVLLANQHPEDVNNTRPSCGLELQTASAYPGELI